LVSVADMDVTPYRRTEQLTIGASPEQVYDLIADVSRMGEWSPVCTGGAYDADDPTWFTGHNAIESTTWSTRCHVVTADPGNEFAFVNCGGDGQRELVRWGFRLTATSDGGTEVTQSWEVLPGYEDNFVAQGKGQDELAARLDFMKGLAETGMPATLEQIRLAAEA
jgi:Polyketide cyclase / dehydrase and lipid transport